MKNVFEHLSWKLEGIRTRINKNQFINDVFFSKLITNNLSENNFCQIVQLASKAGWPTIYVRLNLIILIATLFSPKVLVSLGWLGGPHTVKWEHSAPRLSQKRKNHIA